VLHRQNAETLVPRRPAAQVLDPDVLLAAVIEAVAENLPCEDADVIELPERANWSGSD